jgi:hypothetical protein
MADHSVGVRVQGMSTQDQVLVLARLAETRSSDSSLSPKEIGDLYLQAALPAPAKIANVISALGRKGLVTPGARCGRWKLTPIGRNRSVELMSQMDLAALALPGGASVRAQRIWNDTISRLVGRIYKEVDLSKLESVCSTLHAWIRDDLGLGACSECPPQ